MPICMSDLSARSLFLDGFLMKAKITCDQESCDCGCGCGCGCGCASASGGGGGCTVAGSRSRDDAVTQLPFDFIFFSARRFVVFQREVPEEVIK